MGFLIKEMMKFSLNVMVHGMEAVSKALHEAPQGPVNSGEMDDRKMGNGAPNTDGREIIPLNREEAALNSLAVLTEEAEDGPVKILWQIGRSGRSDFQAEWQAAFDYTVGRDPDTINHPGIPHFISVPGGPRSQGGTGKLDIHFTLDRDYANGELVFTYDRWGAEKDHVLFDGELLAAVSGAGKGKFKHVALSLPIAPSGIHVLTLTTQGGAGSVGHRIDYLKLAETQKTAEDI